MDKEKSLKLPPKSHFLDIHEVVPEEVEGEVEGEEEQQQEEQATKPEEKMETRPKKIPKVREIKRQQRKFSRQVSLETGVSVLNEQSKAKNERAVLPRSGNSFAGYGEAHRFGAMDDGRRENFNMFRTKSTLGKQNSLLPLRKLESGIDHILKNSDSLDGSTYESLNRSVPAGRYFAALTGPELDQVKDSEDILLPKDELWPFLLRFPIGCYGICLGLSSQAILWLNLSTSPATKFLHVTPYINLALWLVALTALFAVTFTYILKCIFYFEAVKREYFHPVRINFFFAPWVVCMFLAIGSPPILVPGKINPAVWCVFMAPYFLLEVKIYGQWLSGGKRRLSRVANPSSHLSVVGNFVGAILAAKVGWKEPAKFFWAIGFAHYLVLFVTLYQRLPTSEALPKELHPVYSMFIAAPSAASIAWQNIYGEFDEVSRTCYFIALFLYILLVVRITFFTGFKFSVAWWSYTFPMTTASLATIKYAEAVPCFITKGMALSLSFMSTTMVCVLFFSTLLHAFLWRTLFPNDLAIAITKKSKEKKLQKKSYDIRRWAKTSALPFVSALKKNHSGNKDSDGEKEEGYGTT